MKILRRGARADHGTKSVDLKLSKMRYNPTVDALDVTFANAASDFATDARHNYTLRLTPKEQANLLSMLAEAGAAMDAEQFSEVFAPALPSLFKLQAMASGLRLAA